MNAHAFDEVARQTTESVSRRSSLLALGAAALSGSLALPGVTAAKQGRKGKNNGNGKGKGKGKGKDKCKAQVGKCEDGIADLCLAIFGEDSQECRDLFSPCCQFLRGCDAAKAFACAVDVFQSAEA